MVRLLMVSYYWPPLGGPGSLRPVKFAKYLPDNGIEPTVLTRRAIAYHSMDSLLAGEVPRVKTIRTESFDPARLCYLAGMRIYRPQPWQVPIKKALNFPDSKFPWIPFVYHAARRIHYDCLFVTAPPFSSFIAGYMLRKRNGRPLILDFRDAWLEFPFMKYDTGPEKKFVSYWEEKVTRHASAIVVVDENIRASLMNKYPWLRGTVHVIPNGYDPEDFKNVNPPRDFTISYLGTVRKERDPENFLIAVQELCRESKLPPDAVQVKFIGHIESEYLKKIKRYPFVRVLGHLPHTKALQEFSKAHAALMTTSDEEYFFPSRQNEYLASGLPIMVCGRSRGMHCLAQAFAAGYQGWIFDALDKTSIKAKILELLANYEQGIVVKNEMPYQEYSRQHSARVLSSLIKNELAVKNQRRS